jgi:DNA processing protein
MGRSNRAERTAWIALAAVDGIGPATFAHLLAQSGSAAAVLEDVRARRLGRSASRVPLRPQVRAALEAVAAEPEAAETSLRGHGLWTVTPLDDGWPDRLRDLVDSPVVLHGWGVASLLQAPRSVAIVGTRRPSPAGRLLATRLATRLAELGVVVISGLAIGIDGAAHAATVVRGAPTLAVIGAGHTTPGPRAHRALLEDIIANHGTVVSELAPWVHATLGTFPRRNRILSGLADAVLVVEAPTRSGAINTAHHALEQGRPLLVAPGRPGDERTAGCLRLLRETEARPLIGVEEAIEDLGLDAAPTANQPADGVVRPGLGEAERAVADRLNRGPADLDGLVTDTGLAPAVVASAVSLLQLRGWVQTMGSTYLPSGALASATLRVGRR